jgi:hypothetical protein
MAIFLEKLLHHFQLVFIYRDVYINLLVFRAGEPDIVLFKIERYMHGEVSSP